MPFPLLSPRRKAGMAENRRGSFKTKKQVIGRNWIQEGAGWSATQGTFSHVDVRKDLRKREMWQFGLPLPVPQFQEHTGKGRFN